MNTTTLLVRLGLRRPPGLMEAPCAHGAPASVLMIAFMIMRIRLRISKGGQISIPASIRHRWGTSTVALEDHGDRVVLQPAPDDPIAAAEGALADEFGDLDAGRLRREAREDEQAAERRETPG